MTPNRDDYRTQIYCILELIFNIFILKMATKTPSLAKKTVSIMNNTTTNNNTVAPTSTRKALQVQSSNTTTLNSLNNNPKSTTKRGRDGTNITAPPSTTKAVTKQ